MPSTAPVTVWKLRSGADRRFRAGHPWVYSNELAESPKGLEPGAPVELRDASGKFLARGYGNPHSLIAFRALSRNPEVADPTSPDAILEKLLSAARLRDRLGLGEVSHRLCFGEADELPGLVIDRYVLEDGRHVFAVQAHTAGSNRMVPALPGIIEALEKRLDSSGKAPAIVLRNDLQVRKLEGLEPEAPRLLRESSGLNLSEVAIQVASALPDQTPAIFHADLQGGQKTGFFLDQVANVQLAAARLGRLEPSGKEPLKILDLCCYVGQWGAQLSRVFQTMKRKVAVTAVDASADALRFAKKNIELAGAHCETLQGDVLRDLGSLSAGSYDLVISDPPALIKGRKDIPAGTHAYLQLNTQAFRLVRVGGGIVSCSCSGLLEEESFLEAVAKAASRNQRSVRWVGRGAPAPDHPMRAEFPEGRYLKCWIGFVE